MEIKTQKTFQFTLTENEATSLMNDIRKIQFEARSQVVDDILEHLLRELIE